MQTHCTIPSVNKTDKEFHFFAQSLFFFKETSRGPERRLAVLLLSVKICLRAGVKEAAPEAFCLPGRLFCCLRFACFFGSGFVFAAAAQDEAAETERRERKAAERAGRRAGAAGIRQDDTGIVYRVEGVRKVVVFAQSLIISKKTSAELSSLL